MTLTDQPTHRHACGKRLIELDLWTVRAERRRSKAGPSTDARSRHGAAWPTRDGVVAARAIDGVEVPADWPLEEARLDLDLGGEGLLRIAYADGGDEAFGLDPNHQRFPLKARRFAVARRVRRAPALRRAEPRRPPGPRPAGPTRPRARRARPPPPPGRRDRRGPCRPRGGAAAARRRRGRAGASSTGRPPPLRLRRPRRAGRRDRSGSGSCRPTSPIDPPGLDAAQRDVGGARADVPAARACARCATATRRTARWR